jgi:hypothetical protein
VSITKIERIVDSIVDSGGLLKLQPPLQPPRLAKTPAKMLAETIHSITGNNFIQYMILQSQIKFKWFLK